jgi:TatD DNase family protein
MPFKLFDIGANLTHKSFENDFEEVIKRSLLNGVGNICITGCDLRDSRRALSLAKKFPNNLISTCGIHPHYADSFSEKSEKEIQEICNDSLVKAIGETGLDFNRNYSDKKNQIKSFLAHIKLANSLNLPMFLHQRDAHEDFIDCLNKETPRTKCVVHCFTGEKKELFNYLDRDFYIGLTGWICDPKRGSHLEELIPIIPLNRLLIETDSPYLLPKNLKVKGRRNEPAFLDEILKKIMSERKESEKKITEMLLKNSLSFFNLQQ